MLLARSFFPNVWDFGRPNNFLMTAGSMSGEQTVPESVTDPLSALLLYYMMFVQEKSLAKLFAQRYFNKAHRI